jgi:transposase
MENLRVSIGIDISSEKFDVCLSTVTTDGEVKVGVGAEFPNTSTGFRKFSRWVDKVNKEKKLPLFFLMEATGAYHEELAYYLHRRGCSVIIVLPSKSKKYMQSLPIKSKTDKVDARNLARFALERKHDLWEPPLEIFRKLRDLTREREVQVKLRTEAKNRLEAANTSYDKDKGTLKRIEKDIKHHESQIAAIEAAIKKLIDSDPDIREKVKNVTTIKGVSLVTAATVIAETDGFRNFENHKQLVSYAGMDVVFNSSGKHEGKSRISKKGNSHIRSGMYMPALSIIRYNSLLGGLYCRLVEKGKNGKLALIAVARKALILIYTLWKKNCPFDPNYQQVVKPA